VVRGLGSIGHSYGNVSNYRTELLAGAEDPVGQPVSVRCRRGKGEVYLNLYRALSFTDEERERERERGTSLGFDNIHASSAAADRDTDVESGNRTI